MSLVQKPSNNLFVVHAHDRQKVQESLKDFGEVEELKGTNKLLLVHLPAKTAATRKTLRSIQKKLGDAGVVHPVLVDESGQDQYPTGEIAVRFQRTPSDAKLKKFAAAHKLRLHSRNEYVPQQAIFEPIDLKDRDVLEAVKEVSQDKNTQLAWANTLSRYDRI